MLNKTPLCLQNRADRRRSGLKTISQDSKANSNRLIIDIHSCIFSIQDDEAHLLYNYKLSMSTFPINCIFCNDDGWHRPPWWGNYSFVFGIPCACIYRMWTDCSLLWHDSKKKKKKTQIAKSSIHSYFHPLKYWSHQKVSLNLVIYMQTTECH